MWPYVEKALALVLIIAIPLCWGLGVEWAFDLRRRRKGARNDEGPLA
jgi:hypothetical protein